MLLQAISRVIYVGFLLPIFVVRRLRGSSPFGAAAHRAPSAWDRRR
jgi:hypothetical protein